MLRTKLGLRRVETRQRKLLCGLLRLHDLIEGEKPKRKRPFVHDVQPPMKGRVDCQVD